VKNSAQTIIDRYALHPKRSSQSRSRLALSLRLFRLEAVELSGDEAASWASAAAPTLSATIAIQHELNAGEARMYPMLLAMVLAQLGFFIRAERRGGSANYGAVALFTALAIAANFTAILVIGVEAAWIVYRVSKRMRSPDYPGAPSIWLLGAAIVAGLAMLAPFAASFEAVVRGARPGAYSWILPPHRFEAIHVFEAGTGTFVFVLLAPLAAWAVFRFRRTAPDAIRFKLLWMWLPPIAVVAGSYVFPRCW
jgi:hypothetical protein